MAAKPFLGKKILLVEDNEISRIVTTDNLTSLGCIVDGVSSGQEFLTKTKEKQYDLIFLDVRMPMMDGYEASKRFRQHENGKSHTIVVALTANALPEDRQHCLDAGMDDYIAKPIHSHALEEMLKKHL